MSKLIEVYAKDMGVKIGTPVLPTHYIPIPFEKYITIHTSDKVPAKNYSYWEIVIKILKKEFESRNIKIIQIGTKQDPHLEGVDIFYNDTTFKQTFFIIKNSLLHVGIDSCPVHIASAYGVPTVSVYGHTYAGTCGPVWKNKRVILEPFRNKKCPSFSLSEHPKSVDSIPVEKIANAVFKTLGFSSFKSEKTLHTGSKFLHKTIDIIPATNNFLDKILNAKIRVRMDLSFDENSLVDILKHTENKIEIITERLVNKDILNYFKSKIEKVVYNSAQFDPEFLEYLKYSNIKFELNCTDKSKLSEERLKYFNFDIILDERTGDKIKDEVKTKILAKNSKVKIDAGKVYFYNGNKMMSIAKNFKDPLFWIDAPYFRFYIDS